MRLVSFCLDDCLRRVKSNFIRQNPQYTLAAIQKGVYVIGMKDQFNEFDLMAHPIADQVTSSEQSPIPDLCSASTSTGFQRAAFVGHTPGAVRLRRNGIYHLRQERPEA